MKEFIFIGLVVLLAYWLFDFIWKVNKLNKFRKNPKIGDRCFFENLNDSRTYGKIHNVSEDKKKVYFISENSGALRWESVNGLFPDSIK